MDDLIQEFLVETNENLAELDVGLVRFEQNPGDAELLGKIFRLVHTIKGTCGFLGLPRLETVAHAGEDVLGRFRDGELAVTPQAVSLILRCLDQIRAILATLEATGGEPDGDDAALIAELRALAEGVNHPAPGPGVPAGHDAMDTILSPADPSGTGTDPYFTDEGFPVAAELLDEVAQILGEDQRRSAETAPAAAPAPAPQPTARPRAPAAPARSTASVAPVAATAAASEGETAGSGVNAGVAGAGAEAEQAKESAAAQQSIRVSVDVLETLMTMVGELVLTRNALLQKCRGKDASDLAQPLQRLSLITTELQEGVMKTRMQPIGKAWAKLPRMVRDLSVETGKKIELKMIGAETELDRQVLEMIKDPLVHMVRNSADHGLERPEERLAAGKPEAGTITLNAFHEGGHIIVEIKDDGRGLNTARIRRKAIENRLASEPEIDAMTDQQVHQLVFRPGFSTAETVTSVSGRGVGMDVVRTNVEKIGGTIELFSEPGRGAAFTVKIPLTLAIVSALIVEAGGQRFAIPQINVLELVHVGGGDGSSVDVINGAPVLNLRDRLLPLVRLRALLNLTAETAEAAAPYFVVVTRVGAYTFGIIVDQVFDTEEIVVKPMARVLRKIPCYSGNTILGDGSVIMILDPNGIATATGQVLTGIGDPDDAVSHDTADSTSLVVFRSAGGKRHAVPMHLVERIEEIAMSTVEIADGHHVVQYRGRLMPLIRLGADEPWANDGNASVLVFSDGGRSIGLVVDAVEDIVRDRLRFELYSERPGTLGSAIIAGKATDVVDVGFHVMRGFAQLSRAEAARTTGGRQDTQARVLLIDDSPFFLEVMTPPLVARGYDVLAATTFTQALRLREEAVKLDAICAGGSAAGNEAEAFARSIKADDRWRDTPLLALIGGGSRHARERCLAAGFDGCIARDHRDELLDALEAIIRGQKEAA